MTYTELQDLSQSLTELETFQKNLNSCGVPQTRLARIAGVSISTFHRKSKNASFTASELIRMIKAINR